MKCTELSEAALRSRFKPYEVEYISAWLKERQDAALFACAGAKVATNKERILVCTRYWVVIFAFRTLQPVRWRAWRLLDLRRIHATSGSAALHFSTGEPLQVQLREAQGAVRASLHAHALIALSLDRQPVLELNLPKEWGTLAVDLAGGFEDMGFSHAWLAHSSYGTTGSALKAQTAAARKHRAALAEFLARVIGRPAKQDQASRTRGLVWGDLKGLENAPVASSAAT